MNFKKPVKEEKFKVQLIKRIEEDITERMKEKKRKWNAILIDGLHQTTNPSIQREQINQGAIKVLVAKPNT